MVGSILAIVLWGLNFGIDFTGGTLMELNFEGARPSNPAIREKLSTLGLEGLTIQPTGSSMVLLRTKEINEETHQIILEELGKLNPNLEELRFESIGPTIGKELKKRAFLSIGLVLVLIIIYIAWVFRRISRPVSSWRYGVIAVAALFHDILITCGVFAALGHFLGAEIDTPFVAALLTILGYSVNNTIVVFDRTRENLLTGVREFAEVVNMSINQTLIRSFNTSLTTLLVLMAIYFFGGETIKYFILALIVGILAGTFSSAFIVSPLLVSWNNWKRH